MFDEDLSDLTVTVNQKTTYKFPSVTDVDGDKWTATVSLGEAAVFTTYDSLSFKFAPLPANARTTPYVIKIKLSDQNTSPKSLSYPFFLTVKSAEDPTNANLN